MMPATPAELIAEAAGRFYYLASPYTHPRADVRELRYTEAVAYSGCLLAAGVFVFAPIVQTHRASGLFELPGDYLFWLDYNRAFMDASAGTILAPIRGWQESKGVRQELEYTRAQGKPVYTVAIHADGSPIIVRGATG